MKHAPEAPVSEKFLEKIRDAVSDRGGGVRGRGEAAHEGRRRGKGTATMKLTTMTQVTLDGVMQGNGGASDEDRRNGFERGGWARGKGDNETHAFINQTYQRADAFLLGRRTYELFAGSWGSLTEQDVPGWEPVMRALNTQPKYVASTTLADPEWPDTTVLSDDLATAIADLKATPGGELQVHGSGELTRWLLQNDLVDEMTLIVVPVVLGQGARLFPQAGPDLALELVESRVDSKGVTIQVFRPAGAPGTRRRDVPQPVHHHRRGSSDAISGFRDRRQEQSRQHRPAAWHQRVQRTTDRRGLLGLRRRTRRHHHGHGHRQPGRATGVQRRAVRGVEGVPCRRLGLGGPRSGCGARARHRASKICDRKIEVRPFH